MATRTWEGDVDSVLGTAGNWSDNTLPTDGDTAIIAENATGTTALTGTIPDAGTLAACRIGPNFTRDIGTTSTAANITATAIDFSGKGSVNHIDSEAANSTVLVAGGARSDNMLILGAQSDIATLTVLGGSGTITVKSSATLDNITIANAPEVTLTISTSVSSVDAITMDSGQVNLGSTAAGAVLVLGGQLTLTDAAALSDATDGLKVDQGGIVIAKSSGTIALLTVYGGTFDGRQNANAVTIITNATIHEGGRVLLQSGLDNWTLTNGMVFHGGDFRPPRGKTLTIA